MTRKLRGGEPYALPADPDLDALPRDTRAAIASHWRHRATSELRVAVAFERLLPRLGAVSASDVVLELTAKAISDERRHGGLCVRLAERYLGEPVETPDVGAPPLPAFGTGDEALEVALLVLGHCCINESIASAWIHACQELATAPTAIFANKVHLRDEIDHARLGWAHFASESVTPSMRSAIRAWLPAMLEANVAEWKRADAFLPSEGIAAHGHPSLAMNHRIVDEAVRDIVLPGFAHVGLR